MSARMKFALQVSRDGLGFIVFVVLWLVLVVAIQAGIV